MEVTLKAYDKTILETQQILNGEVEAYDETIIEGEVSDIDSEQVPEIQGITE